MFPEMGIGLQPNDWHLSIDNSSQSLKYVLHNRNQYPSITEVLYANTYKEYKRSYMLIHIKNIKENCEKFSFLIKTIDYNGGYTNQYCFLCLWDSGATF